MPSAAIYPPGPRSLAPWQGLRFYVDFVRYMDACTARHGSVFTLRLHPFGAFVCASDPADVQAILTDTERFVGGDAARLLEPLVGPSSVIITSGATHMRQRKLLLPSFRGDLVARWRDRIAAIADEQLAQLPAGEPVALRPVMQRITIDVICRLVFGVEDDAELTELRERLLSTFDPRLAAFLFVPTLLRRHGRLNPGRLLIERRALVHRLLDRQIARGRAGTLGSGSGDVLSLLIAARDEDGEALSDAELRDQLLTLLVAGHETTATGLAWAVERLSRTPGAHARLVEELDGEQDEAGAGYLDAVVRETLRLRPPVIDAVRTTTRDDELGGHPIPAGTLVSAMFTVTHRRPDLWEQPLAFRPERFLDDKPVPYAYTPFGGGIRRCIGAALADLEMKVVLRTLLERFELAPAPGREEAVRLTGITLTPSRGGQAVLTRRPARRPAASSAAAATPEAAAA
jgi:cytochrome P450